MLEVAVRKCYTLKMDYARTIVNWANRNRDFSAVYVMAISASDA